MTCDLIRAMRALPAPIVASLNGTVAGAGAAIALASDLRVAADTARIAFLFVKVGLAGADMGGAQLLPRIVGLGRATELLMTGEFVDARGGPPHRPLQPRGARAELPGRGDGRAGRASSPAAPRRAWPATKDALEREAHMDLEQALDHEARVQARADERGPTSTRASPPSSRSAPPRFEGAPE